MRLGGKKLITLALQALMIGFLVFVSTPAPAHAAEQCLYQSNVGAKNKYLKMDKLEPCIDPSNADAQKNFPWIINTWKWSLTVINAFAAIVLILMAFSNILYPIKFLESYRIKQLLPTLIYGLFLANTSMFVCRFIVAIADMLMGFGGFDVGNLQHLYQIWGIDIKQLYSSTGGGVIKAVGGNIQPATQARDALFWLIIGIFKVYVPLIFLTILAFVMYIRYAVIFLFTAISPLAFGSIIFPATQSYLRSWFKIFVQYAFGGVASAFLLRLAMQFNGPSTTSSGGVLSWGIDIIPYAISLALIYYAIKAPFSMFDSFMNLGSRWGALGNKGIAAGTSGAKTLFNSGKNLAVGVGASQIQKNLNASQDKFNDIAQGKFKPMNDALAKATARGASQAELDKIKEKYEKQARGQLQRAQLIYSASHPLANIRSGLDRRKKNSEFIAKQASLNSTGRQKMVQLMSLDRGAINDDLVAIEKEKIKEMTAGEAMADIKENDLGKAIAARGRYDLLAKISKAKGSDINDVMKELNTLGINHSRNSVAGLMAVAGKAKGKMSGSETRDAFFSRIYSSSSASPNPYNASMVNSNNKGATSAAPNSKTGSTPSGKPVPGNNTPPPKGPPPPSGFSNGQGSPSGRPSGPSPFGPTVGSQNTSGSGGPAITPHSVIMASTPISMTRGTTVSSSTNEWSKNNQQPNQTKQEQGKQKAEELAARGESVNQQIDKIKGNPIIQSQAIPATRTTVASTSSNGPGAIPTSRYTVNAATSTAETTVEVGAPIGGNKSTESPAQQVEQKIEQNTSAANKVLIEAKGAPALSATTSIPTPAGAKQVVVGTAAPKVTVHQVAPSWGTINMGSAPKPQQSTTTTIETGEPTSTTITEPEKPVKSSTQVENVVVETTQADSQSATVKQEYQQQVQDNKTQTVLSEVGSAQGKKTEESTNSSSHAPNTTTRVSQEDTKLFANSLSIPSKAPIEVIQREVTSRVASARMAKQALAQNSFAAAKKIMNDISPELAAKMTDPETSKMMIDKFEKAGLDAAKRLQDLADKGVK